MKVLSLFDGISCGMVALERAGIPVEEYAAYEIDKYAKQVSERNYPQIKQFGDVTTADFTKHKGFDLLIGGSPCTFWSIARPNRETSPDGMGGKLFMEYVRALKESGCRWFLYENNYSIHKSIKSFISEQLEVEPIMINSALVSAQHRRRCYWTNIPNITQPEDKGLVVQDVLESGLAYQDKSYCVTSTYRPTVYDSFAKHRNTLVAEPVLLNVNKDGKARTIKAGYGHSGLRNAARTDGFGATMIAQPIRVGQYGIGGQGQRIYSVKGKSVTLSANGGGQGAKTGLYKIDLPDGDYIIRKLTPLEAERLQTLPDNYTEGISDSQRYKCIGNGWTIDIITHILSFLPQEERLAA